MIVEIVTRLGGPAVRLDASQLLVRGDNGAALCVAGEYGPAGAVRVAHRRDADFDRTLRAFGYGDGPVEVIVLPSLANR